MINQLSDSWSRMLERCFNPKVKTQSMPVLNIQEAMEVLSTAMEDTSSGSYASGWHDNIAMQCYDSILADNPNFDNKVAHTIGNETAKRFMSLAFNADMTNHFNQITKQR